VLQCGYKNLSQTTLSSAPIWENAGAEPPLQEETSAGGNGKGRPNIMHILATKTERRRRMFQDITKSKDVVHVLQASGSVKSIMDQACKAKLDSRQRRAFEIITASFVLTFCSEAVQNEDRHSMGRQQRTMFRPFLAEKRKLDVNRGDIVRPWSHGAGSECSVLIHYSHNSHSLFNYTRIDR